MRQRSNEGLSSTYKRRNSLLLSLFNKMGMEVTFLGDLRKPNIILNFSEQLPMFVKNFNLHIKHTVYSEDYFHTFSLDDIDNISQEEFFSVLDQAKSEPVYKIRLNDLYYVGTKIDKGSGEYFPVFSKQHPKIYYTTSKALEESYKLRTMGYKTEYQ